MTGPEHYREAERLLNLAQEQKENWSAEQQTYIATRAGAHATLALAAATAVPAANAYDGDEDGSRSRGWSGVA